MASELEVANVKAETYRSGRSDGDVYIQAATASDFVAIGTQVSSTLLKVDGSGKLSCVNDITIQKNNGNLILHGTADGSQQAVLFRNDEDEDKGFIKYRDTYSSAGGNTMEVGTDGTTRLTISSTGLATFACSGSQHIVISDGAGTPSTWDVGRDTTTGNLVIRQNASTKMTVSGAGIANITGGITVKGTNNWSHISSQDGQSVSIADDAQIQIADVEAGAMLVHVYDRGTGYGGLIFVSYAGAPVIVADPSGVFAVADTDNKYCVYKSSDVGSHDVFLKNRSGGTKGFSVLVTAAVLDDF